MKSLLCCDMKTACSFTEWWLILAYSHVFSLPCGIMGIPARAWSWLQTQEVWGSTRGVWVLTLWQSSLCSGCGDYHTRCSSLSTVFSVCDWGAFQADCCLSALVLRGRVSAEPHTRSLCWKSHRMSIGGDSETLNELTERGGF